MKTIKRDWSNNKCEWILSSFLGKMHVQLFCVQFNFMYQTFNKRIKLHNSCFFPYLMLELKEITNRFICFVEKGIIKTNVLKTRLTNGMA